MLIGSPPVSQRREKTNIAWLEYTSEYPNNLFFVFMLWRTLYDFLFSSYHEDPITPAYEQHFYDSLYRIFVPFVHLSMTSIQYNALGSFIQDVAITTHNQ